ncbi:MAG: Lrp/AsnC family transcriptional regulator [Candidatus Hodarchaeales archaeon]|jgi:Lrp/AsnC family transcriptional regulator for asnA, asnC and gidA
MSAVTNEDVLNILTEDSSRTWKQLAQELNISDTALRKRVKKLRENGVIKRFTIEVDQRKLGFEITSFIGFDVEAVSYNKILEVVRNWEEVRSIFQTSIDHDFLMECWFKNNDDLSFFLGRLEKLKGVTKVCPATVTQRLK